jgi:hypothetical protein
MPLSANSSAVLNVSMNSLTSGQNARLRAGIEKETEGATLVSTRHSPRQFPLHPYTWYNNEHHHSGIAYLTPAKVHYGRAQEILDARHRVITAAASQHWERFVHGLPKRIEAPSAVWINPPAGPQPLRHGPGPPPQTIDSSVSH